MSYFILCSLTLFVAYLINITYVSVFYHRGLTHNALKLKPWFQKFVVATGTWVTGLDPKPWTVMHRMHHLYSDTPEDPHSPVNVGVVGVLLAQKKSYCDATWGLIREEKKYTSLVKDLDFPVNRISKNGLWWTPYALHASIVLILGLLFGSWVLGMCYFVGMMSHPIQGWMVNSLGHRFGYRNFNTPDHSKNNLIVSAVVMGEGYQNNHHERPRSANFGVKAWEWDLGFLLCKIGEGFRVLDILKNPIQLGQTQGDLEMPLIGVIT